MSTLENMEGENLEAENGENLEELENIENLENENEILGSKSDKGNPNNNMVDNKKKSMDGPKGIESSRCFTPLTSPSREVSSKVLSR